MTFRPAQRNRSAGQDRVELDLDLPARVDQTRNDDHRARRADLTEDAAMRVGDLVDVVDRGEEMAGPHDIGDRATEFGERPESDLPATTRLGAGLGHHMTIGPDRRRAGDVDVLAVSDGT